MNWRQKALVFRLLGSIPGRDRIHYLLQKHVTKSIPRPASTYPRYMGESMAQLRILQPQSAEQKETYFEFGAGWDLFHNLVLFCFGVEQQLLIDLTAHMHPDLVNAVISNLQRSPPPGALRLPTRPLGSRPLTELREWYGITYLAPADACKVPLDSCSVAMAGTTNTLEHIPFSELPAIMTELRRLCASHARIAMQVDYSDHYSHSDPSISPYNFLQFGEADWRRYNTHFHFQNRRRHSDYRKLFTTCGFSIVGEEIYRPAAWEAQLDAITLHQDFREYGRDDVGVTSATFSLRPG